MHRRMFLSTTLAAPAIVALGTSAARAATQGSTLLQAPGFSASGSFEMDTYVAGQRGQLAMAFTDGPRVSASLGAGAISRIAGVQSGDRVSLLYVGYNGGDSVSAEMAMGPVSRAGARADFSANGVAADVSAIVGGAQYAGAGLAAMIVAALSAGAALRQSPAARFQAAISSRPVGGAYAFGLEVTLRPA